MMSSLNIRPASLRKGLRPFFLAGVALLILVDIFLLLPSSIEEKGNKTSSDPQTFVPEKEQILATGIPKNQVPDYTVEKFSYLATQGTEKEWKLDADQAYLFNHEKLVHARKVKAFLYDSEGKITVITGREAKYITGDKNLEIFGTVKTLFPDGFELTSDYLRYLPSQKSIQIPTHYRVQGRGNSHTSSLDLGQKLNFDSNGFEFEIGKGQITLPQSARVFVQSSNHEKTIIASDRCVIQRNEQNAHFTMNPKRRIESRFVKIQQTKLNVRARRVELHFGSTAELPHYLVAQEDVLIQEMKQKEVSEPLKYGTGGQASFDTKKNVITLTEFPQVYQGNDTVTGDVIIWHRDTDVVEVEHSNAFSQGQHSPE